VIVAAETDRLAAIVTRQVGRAPRTPWRVAATCTYGFPTVIASPSRLDDGTPFPTLYWLTCPFLSEAASAAESAGWLSEWDARIAEDPDLAASLALADAELRKRRVAESAGRDACGSAGVAGQCAVLATKCLHARVALALVGIDDAIGGALLEHVGEACVDRRCDALDPGTSPTEGTP
jgi:uncharacterized protein